jgi:O-antigen ligase
MNINKNGSNFGSTVNAIIYLSVVICFLISSITKEHFLVLTSALQPLVIGLLIYSLFVDTKHIKNGLNWWVYFLIFGLIAFLSTHGSHDYLISSIKIVLDFYILAFCFLVYVIFFKEIPRLALPTLFLVVLVFVVVAAPLTLSEIILQTRFDDRAIWSQGGGLTSSFKLTFYNHIRHFSSHAFIASCCAYILLKSVHGNTFLKFATYFLITFCVFSMLLAYGRGSILAFLAFIAIDSYFQSGVSKAVKNLSLTVLAILVFYTLLYFTSLGVITEFLFSSVLRGNETTQLGITQRVNAVSSGRVDMWLYGIERALSSPIFGHGAGSALWLFEGTPYVFAVHPHNSLVQFVMDFGFLGAAILFFVFAKAMWSMSVCFSSAIDNEYLRRSLVSFFFAYILFSFTDGLLYQPLPMMNFFLILAVLIATHSAVQAEAMTRETVSKA